MNYGMDMVQINDGLTQTAACASATAYDKENGLVFVSYMTGIPKHYGESTGRICLSVFCPSQPENARHRIIDTGVGASRGLLCTAIYLVGDGKVRIIFSTTRGELATYYRDYDFYADIVSERTEVFLRTENEDVRLNRASYKKYLETKGLDPDNAGYPIIDPNHSIIVNKVTKYQGEFYTAVTADDLGFPILCKIEDNILLPFAVCPEPMT